MNLKKFILVSYFKINAFQSILSIVVPVLESNQSSSPMRKTPLKQNKYAKKNLARERMLNTSNKYLLDNDGLQLSLPKEARLCNLQVSQQFLTYET